MQNAEREPTMQIVISLLFSLKSFIFCVFPVSDNETDKKSTPGEIQN